MSVTLEHANLTVRDPDAVLQFLQCAFPDFRVRGEGLTAQGARWLHVGTQDTYIALTQALAPAAEPWVPYGGRPGLNHLGFVVDDVERIRQRLSAAGYRDSTVANAHPARRRVYFLDPEGNDWEFVQYLATDKSARNDYDLPDSP